MQAIRIRMFGGMKDYFSAELDLELAGPASVAAIKDRLAQRSPESLPLLDRCCFAVDDAMVTAEAELRAGQRLDVMPPFSGG